MKIAFAGTHSTGKTTLVDALKTEEDLAHLYYFDVNVTRWVKNLGFDINLKTTNESQEINMIKRVAHLNTFDYIIADRSIADVLAYSQASEVVDATSLAYQKRLYYNNISKYDLIFYVPPVFQGVDDGVRSAGNEKYREEIDELVKQNLTVVPYTTKIHRIEKYSIRERLQEVMDVINELRKSKEATPGN